MTKSHFWTIIAVFVVYFGAAWYGLYISNAGIVATALVLFGIPSILLAHYSYAPPMVLLSVSFFGIGLTFLLEGIAHLYGLWHTVGFSETRVFDLVAAEVIVVAALQSIFLVLLYELFFDDGSYTMTSVRDRFSAFIVFAVGAILLIFAHQFWDISAYLSYSYWWIVGILLIAAMASLYVYRAYSVSFFNRLVYYSLFSAFPLGIALALAASNTHKIFNDSAQYLLNVNFYQTAVPLEELILLFAIPFLIATVYELYLDDRN